MQSTSGDSRSKNIRIGAVIVPELKLRDVERKIFGTDFVERADYATLEDRPKTFNRIRVHRADNVLLFFVMHGLARIFLQARIDLMFVSRQETDFVRHSFANKSLNARLVYMFKHAGDDVALALDGADDRGLASASAAAFAVVALVPVAVLILAADPSFINLHDAAQLRFRLHHRRADFMGHIQRRLVRAKAQLPLNLKRANTFLAGRHKVHDLKPLAKRLVCVLKNCARDMGEAVALIRRTLIALPLVGHRTDRKDFYRTTARANDASGPTAGDQVSLAGIFVRKGRLKLGFRHLVNGLGALGLGHGCLRNSGGDYGM